MARLADICLSPLNIFLCIITILRPGPGSPLDSNWTRKMEVCAIPSFWCISCIFEGVQLVTQLMRASQAVARSYKEDVSRFSIFILIKLNLVDCALRFFGHI